MRSKLNDFINMSTALSTGEAEAGTLYREEEGRTGCCTGPTRLQLCWRGGKYINIFSEVYDTSLPVTNNRAYSPAALLEDGEYINNFSEVYDTSLPVTNNRSRPSILKPRFTVPQVSFNVVGSKFVSLNSSSPKATIAPSKFIVESVK